MAISGLLFNGLWDEHTRAGKLVVLIVAAVTPCRAALKKVHAELNFRLMHVRKLLAETKGGG